MMQLIEHSLQRHTNRFPIKWHFLVNFLPWNPREYSCNRLYQTHLLMELFLQLFLAHWDLQEQVDVVEAAVLQNVYPWCVLIIFAYIFRRHLDYLLDVWWDLVPKHPVRLLDLIAYHRVTDSQTVLLQRFYDFQGEMLTQFCLILVVDRPFGHLISNHGRMERYICLHVHLGEQVRRL